MVMRRIFCCPVDMRNAGSANIVPNPFALKGAVFFRPTQSNDQMRPEIRY
ncbi:hypothetical protein GCM10023310_50390 [Paenibacillus vulneris]